jgi:hypothetical protein
VKIDIGSHDPFPLVCGLCRNGTARPARRNHHAVFP